ncbi:hypothetical protein ACEYW6_36695 [Nostoc sp. UIC 10607]|uniref:hypothetical protein n=1 Tax=Nostoc sp. UIC 10607 TaxID=3045935 RepID=UPI0039A1B358
MSDEEGFPKQLLEQSIPERIAYFKNYTMAHPKLLSASQKLMLTVEEPAATSLMFLFGPTGVGKTTLLRRMRHHRAKTGKLYAKAETYIT